MKSVKLLVCVCLLAIVNLGGGKGCPTPPVPGVDLRVTQIGVYPPKDLMWGATVPVEVVLQNHGTEDFEGSVFGNLFVQSERSEDFQCGGLEPWGITVDFLQIPAGEEGRFFTSFNLCRPGVYTLTVDLQFIPDDVIDENNSMATTALFEWEEKIDLTYHNFGCWMGGDPYPPIVCEVGVLNIGNTPIGEGKLETWVTMITPDGEETLFDATVFISELAPGWYIVLNVSFEETGPGWYTFFLEIDPNNLVKETDETNNSISVFLEL